MKFLAAFLLVVASVHANSLHYYGWIPGKESLFKYESQVLLGIPEIKESHFAGVKLSSKVRVQAYSDYSLRIKIEEPEFLTLNGEVKLSENGYLIKEQSPEVVKTEVIPEQFKHFLEQPFLVYLKSGVVTSFLVAQEEPVSVTNLKKAVLAQIQLDIAGTRRSTIDVNHIQLPVSEEGQVSEAISYFTTSEETVEGECLTEYTVHKLPQWKINEIEEAWTKEELVVKGMELSSSSLATETLKGRKQCKGKPYYMITKSVNFDQCKNRPIFQQWTNLVTSCDVTKASCQSTLAHLATTNTYICGELDAFVVRKTVQINGRQITPMGYKTEEQFVSMTKINLELLGVESITQRLPMVPTTKTIKSLVYMYPEEAKTESSVLDNEVVTETELVLGVRPVLPQPGLTEAPNALLPVTIPREQIIPQVYAQLKKMAREVYESPESNAAKSDLAGTLTTIAQYMRLLSLTELEELEKKIMEESLSGYKTIEKIYYDTLAVVGTNPSSMLVIKKVLSGSLPTPLLSTLVAKTIRSVRYPTKALLGEFVKMVKSQTVLANKPLITTAILNLSNLFYRAYVNPTTMMATFPTKVYGVFGTKESPVLVDEYIPFLIEQVTSQPKSVLKLAAISSLGKLGHIKALKPLLMVTEEAPRTVAVFSLKRIAKINPSVVRPILMSIITNPVESQEVRIAAVSVLPFASPSVSELQTLAIRSWFEPSKQVSSFIYTTLKSLAYTQIPVLKIVGLRAKLVLPLIKPEVLAIHRSHNIIGSTLIEYLDTVVSNQLQLVNSKESLIPTHLFFNSKSYGPLMTEFGGITLGAYTRGMDTLIEKYLPYLGYPTRMSPPVQRQLEQITQELRLKTREIPTPEAYLQSTFFGTESAMLVDSEFMLQTVEEIYRELEQLKSFEFTHVSAEQVMDTTDIGFTAAGLPLMMVTATPTIIAIKGSVKTETIEGKLLPKITAKVIPVINGKMQSSFGVISPFTEELIATGVEMSLHSSIPVEIEAMVSKGQLEVALRTPHEVERSGHEIEPLHGFVLPYTVKQSLLTIKPLSQSPALLKIVSPSIRSPIEIPVGETIGLSGRIVYQSDAKFIDLSSYIQKLIQHSPTSLIITGIIPSSLRLSSTKLQYFPAKSETKEIRVILKLTNKGLPYYWSAGPINESELAVFPEIKEILAKLVEPTSSATVVELITLIKTTSEAKTIKSAVVVGHKYLEQPGSEIVKTLGAVAIKPITGPSYSIKYEGSIVLPSLMHKLNIESLIQESLKLVYEGTLVAKLPIVSEELKVNLKTNLIKTELLKKSIMESPEYKKCVADIHLGRQLSPMCLIVRQQAASLDKVELTLEVPKVISRSPVITVLADLLKYITIGQIQYETPEVPVHGEQDIIKIEAVVDRIAEVSQVKLLTPITTLKIKNIRLLGLTKNIFPLSLYTPVSSLLPLKLSGSEIPATCRVEPKSITTFDNKTIGYMINDCEHVLVVDGSKALPIAVLTRTLPQQKKIVKVLAGVVEAILTPVSSGMEVKINGAPVTLKQGATFVKTLPTGKVVLIKRYVDNVYLVSIPSLSLTVLTDGVIVEVVAPQLLKSRAAGLCGNMDGEITADLKTPEMCIMKPKLVAVSYILNKAGSSPAFPHCAGIPTELRKEFEEESRKCIKEEIIPTPVLKLVEKISILNKPIVSAHVVEKQVSQVCISKQMLKVCSSPSSSALVTGENMSVPKAIKPVPVEFVCIPRPTTLAQTLVKRALAGESLYLELSELPIAYSKVEFEPVVCTE